MSALPDPPVPPDLDLSGLEYMPLLVARLRRSKAWLRAKRRPELGFYMLNLWMAAWMEKPAASLDDDDDVLADAAMCDPAKWPGLRADVMAGFVKHSDGRLYHHVLVEQARIALEKRIRWRGRKQKQRGSPANAGTCPADVRLVSRGTGAGHARDMALRDETGRDATNETNENDGTGRDGEAVPASPAESSPPPDHAALEADRITEAFRLLREARWPSDSRLHAPLMTLRAQATEWVALGGTVAFCREHMARVMDAKRRDGEGPPTDLGFCCRSVPDAIARHRAQHAGASRPVENVSEAERRYRCAFDRWCAGGRIGPAPSREEAAA